MTHPIDLEPAALKSCPFCGGQSKSWQCGDQDEGYWAVECHHGNTYSWGEPTAFVGVHGDGRAETEAAWNRRAARSVPEAGKAVTDAATALVNFAWSAVVTDCTESAEHLNELVDNLRSALASVPAPSGAEPIGYMREKDNDGTAFWVSKQRNSYYTKPVFASAPQAALAEDIAGLKEWKSAIIGLCRALGSDDMEWGGDKTGWGFIFYFVKHLHTRVTASEAEAADLRRKLEEHRRALAEAREHINRYADTAAEHDLVARIDALTGAFE